MANRKDLPERYALGWLDSLDKRTGLAKDLIARYKELCEDLGGLDMLSYQQRSICERIIWLEYSIHSQERLLVADRDFDTSRLTQSVNALSGLYGKLGPRVSKISSFEKMMNKFDDI